MPDIALVIVNYFSVELARDAIASARSTTSASLEVVVVDNSCDARERSRLAECGADRIIEAPDNLGYASGANLGIVATVAPIVVVANPDVIFGDQCLDRLSERLTGNVAVAGPAFHWDDRGEWLLPPADLLDEREKLSQALASRLPMFRRRRERSRLKRRIEFWRRKSSARIEAVSGAVMAFRRDLLDEVNGFDPRYALYFEEIDLIRRLRSKGWSAVYVPEARCRHLYNQSAGSHPESLAKFHRSEQLYLDRWAPLTSSLVRILSKAVNDDEPAFDTIGPSQAIPASTAGDEWLVEASPLSSFESAAGCFAEDSVRFPDEVWKTYRSPALYLRVVNPATLDIERRFVMRKG